MDTLCSTLNENISSAENDDNQQSLTQIQFIEGYILGKNKTIQKSENGSNYKIRKDQRNYKAEILKKFLGDDEEEEEQEQEQEQEEEEVNLLA